MIWMYIRILLTILAVIIAYSLLVFFMPIVGEKIDSTLWVSWNQSLTNYLDALFSDAKEVQNTIEYKVNNPAPNTSKNIRGRIGE